MLYLAPLGVLYGNERTESDYQFGRSASPEDKENTEEDVRLIVEALKVAV